MLKYFIATLFLSFILSFLLNCQEGISPTQPLNQNESAAGIFAKKPSQVELGVYFKIFDVAGQNPPVVHIEDGIFKENGIVDFTNNTYKIEYTITHPDDNERVEFVRLGMAYDEDSDGNVSISSSDLLPNQMNYWVFQHEAKDLAEPLNELSGGIEWSGKVTQHEVDYQYEKYENHALTLYDQRATYSENPIPGTNDKADHYVCYLWSEGTGRFTKTLLIKFGVWIIAKDPDYVYYVDNIYVDGTSSKRRTIIPTADISLGGNYPTNNIYICGYWNFSSDLYVSDGTISSNIVTVTGPKVRSKENIKFTVYAIRTAYGAYDPYENSIGNWPDVLPYGILPIP